MNRKTRLSVIVLTGFLAISPLASVIVNAETTVIEQGTTTVAPSAINTSVLLRNLAMILRQLRSWMVYLR